MASTRASRRATRFLRMRDAGVTSANVTLAIHENQTEAARALAMWDRLIAENEDVVSSCNDD